MMRLLPLAAVMAALLAGQNPAEDALARAKAESNLERRSEMALAAADQALNTSRKAYREAQLPLYETSLQRVREGVELALAALKEKGRSLKYYKKAEQRSRAMLRKMEDFAKEAALEDRPPIEAVGKVVENAHAEFLRGVLRK